MQQRPLCESIFKKLISFDTVSSKSNLGLIEYCAQLLEDSGFNIVYTYNEDQSKANLFASLGPQNRPGVILSGHTDVVPVTGQCWDSDPFSVLEKDNAFYGRGSCDMKGFIACALSTLPMIRKLKNKLFRPLHFSLTFDEEVGCLGAPLLLDNLPQNWQKPELVWVGEPTSLNLVMAHKGIMHGRAQIHTQFAHSSRPDLALNSNLIAAEMICEYYRFLEQLQGPNQLDDSFWPPYTTGNIGVLRGGYGANIIAGKCEFEWEMRPLPNVDMNQLGEDMKEKMAAVTANYKNCHHQMNQYAAVRPFAFAGHEKLMQIYDFLNLTSTKRDYQTVSYATEAGLFQANEITAFVLGPGSIEQAHKPNEFVTLQQLIDCEKLLENSLGNYCLR